MDKKNLIILIAISLMISNVSSACTSGTAATYVDGKCCGASGGATAGKGV